MDYALDYVVLDLNPFRKRVDREAFCNWDEEREVYRITRDVTIHLPGYQFRTLQQDGWATHNDCITVFAGYEWDGPSGPAINGETNVVGSLVHDIICTQVCISYLSSPTFGYPLEGYFKRHRLYREINRSQGEGLVRAWYQWGGLVAGNWVFRLLKG